MDLLSKLSGARTSHDGKYSRVLHKVNAEVEKEEERIVKLMF
jgi:hypothetical protein